MQIKKICFYLLCFSILTACENKTANQAETTNQTETVNVENTASLQEQIKKADEDFKKCIFDNFKTPEKCRDKEMKIKKLKNQSK